MRGSCISCKHWLPPYVQTDDHGWCLLPIVVETKCDPPNIQGYVFESETGGIETHKAAICDAYEAGFADDVKKPKKK